MRALHRYRARREPANEHRQATTHQRAAEQKPESKPGHTPRVRGSGEDARRPQRKKGDSPCKRKTQAGCPEWRIDGRTTADAVTDQHGHDEQRQTNDLETQESEPGTQRQREDRDNGSLQGVTSGLEQVLHTLDFGANKAAGAGDGNPGHSIGTLVVGRRRAGDDLPRS